MGWASDDLFGFIKRPSAAKKNLIRISAWIRRIRERFASFVVLSLALHVMVFGFLAVSQAGREKPRIAAAGADNAQAVSRALQELRLDTMESAILSEALAGLTEDLEEVFERPPQLDPRLGKWDRTEIFRFFGSNLYN